jgi:hypothetical protein
MSKAWCWAGCASQGALQLFAENAFVTDRPLRPVTAFGLWSTSDIVLDVARRYRPRCRGYCARRAPCGAHSRSRPMKAPIRSWDHRRPQRGGLNEFIAGRVTRKAAKIEQVSSGTAARLHQARGNRSYIARRAVPPAAECPPSFTHFPKRPKHGKAAFRPLTVSLACRARSRGG